MKVDIQPFLERYRDTEGNIITLLQDIQQKCGYIPEQAVFDLADALDIPASQFFGVATFYTQFHLAPRGENIVTACCGTACHVRGAERLIRAAERELGVTEAEPTSADGKFTLERVACLGTCSLAPVVLLNGSVNAKLSPDKLRKAIARLKEMNNV
ncbi:MAG: nuoE4 [Nitrospirae bacterium]|nr:MAG: nuoE4 [Nitrospirota bacterium]